GSVNGEAIGFTIAFNTIGWNAQDLFTQTIDAIIGAPHLAEIGDPDYSLSDPDIADLKALEYGDAVKLDASPLPAGVTGEEGATYLWQGEGTETESDNGVDLLDQDYTDTDRWRKVLLADVFGGVNASGAVAYIQDSRVSTDGDLDVTAVSAVQLAAETRSANISDKANNATVQAKHGYSSQAVGGLVTGNKVATEARAWIDNGGIVDSTDNAIDVGGSLRIHASDTPGDNDVLAIEPA